MQWIIGLCSVFLLLQFACAFRHPYLRVASELHQTYPLVPIKASREDTANEPSTFLSSVALISGTAVGAGVLALPEFTRSTGVLPSSIGLIFSWVVMAATGLLMAEVVISQSTRKDFNKGAVMEDNLGLLSVANSTLGRSAGVLVGTVYLFLHYALLVAYIVEGGQIISETLGMGEGYSEFLFTALIGGVLIKGSDVLVDSVNDLLAGLTVLTFGLLVYIGLPFVSLDNISRMDWSCWLQPLPVMLLALVSSTHCVVLCCIVLVIIIRMTEVHSHSFHGRCITTLFL